MTWPAGRKRRGGGRMPDVRATDGASPNPLVGEVCQGHAGIRSWASVRTVSPTGGQIRPRPPDRKVRLHPRCMLTGYTYPVIHTNTSLSGHLDK